MKYRRLLLRSARIRIGDAVRVSGMPAILAGVAAVIAASGVATWLVLIGSAAIARAAALAAPPADPSVAVPLDGADYAVALRGERPGLRP